MGQLVFIGCQLLGIIGGFKFAVMHLGVGNLAIALATILGWGIGVLVGLYLYDKLD